MKLTIDHAALIEATAWAGRAIPNRPATPILAGMMINAHDGRVTISGYDYDTYAAIDVDAQIDTDGDCLIDGRKLAEIAKKLPKRPVDISLTGSTVTIKAGTSKMTMLAMPIADYPKRPTIAEATGSIAGDTLTRMAAVTLGSVDRGDTLPILTGAHVVAHDGTLTIAATDRYRLARTSSTEWDGADLDVIIPGRALESVTKWGAAATVQISAGNGSVAFTSGARTLSTRTLDGTYPSVDKLIPASVETAFTVSATDMVTALGRAQLGADSRIPRVDIAVDAGDATISASTDNTSAQEHVTVDGDAAAALTINAAYLAESLNALGGRVRIGITQRLIHTNPVTDDGEVDTATSHVVMLIKKVD